MFPLSLLKPLCDKILTWSTKGHDLYELRWTRDPAATYQGLLKFVHWFRRRWLNDLTINGYDGHLDYVT